MFVTSTRDGDASLRGTWNAVVSSVNPLTGTSEVVESDRQIAVSIEGKTVRLSSASGWFVQGVWVAEDQAAFRVVIPNPQNSGYRTVPGCEVSASLDCVGELRVAGPDSMTLALFYQSRDPLGSQVQTAEYLEIRRVPVPGTGASLVAGVLLCARRRRRTVSFNLEKGRFV